MGTYTRIQSIFIGEHRIRREGYNQTLDLFGREQPRIDAECHPSPQLIMTKILLVEDDEKLARNVRDWLKSEAYNLETASTGTDALQLLSNFKYDIVLLDWGLPDIAGLDVCKSYRRSGGRTPIIFLTGKGEIVDKELGLNSGADDYLVKPFDLRELTARIKSVLRRPVDMVPSELSIGDLVFNPVQRTVSVNDLSVRLIPKECVLLEYLMRHPKRAFSAKALLDAAWPSESGANEESVRTNMKTLRHKLSKLGKGSLITTVLGAGYVIEDS